MKRIHDYTNKAKHGRVKDAVIGSEKHLTALLTPTAIDLLQHCPSSALGPVLPARLAARAHVAPTPCPLASLAGY